MLKKKVSVLVLLGILTGLFFSNGVWLLYSLGGLLNMGLCIISLVCLIVIYEKHIK